MFETLTKVWKSRGHQSRGTSQGSRRRAVHHRRLTCEPLEARHLLSITLAADAVPPLALLDPNSVAFDVSTATFDVAYRDTDSSVMASTIGDYDVRVTGPDGFDQTATLLSKTSTTNLPEITAVYQIVAPSGAWGPENEGTYVVTMEANEVCDANNNYVPGGTTVGSYTVGDAPETSPPTAFTGNTSFGVSTALFDVTYMDGAGHVLASSIGDGDVRVTGPNGFDQIAEFVSKTPNTDNSPITATYRLTPPGGAWGLENNGIYTVSVLADEVCDVESNFMPAGEIGPFEVFNQDLSSPTANLDTGSVVLDATTATFDVIYSDSISAVKVSTLGTGDIRVTGPAGFDQYATFVSATPGTNGTPIIADLLAPGSRRRAGAGERGNLHGDHAGDPGRRHVQQLRAHGCNGGYIPRR